MWKSLVCILVVQLILQCAEQRPLHETDEKDAIYARQVFTKLIHDVVFRNLLAQRLQRSVMEQGETAQDNSIVELNQSFDENVVFHPRKEDLVTMVLAVSDNWFGLHKWKFLRDVEKLIDNTSVKCKLSSTHPTPNINVLVEFFCYYVNTQQFDSLVVFVPPFKIKKKLEASEDRNPFKFYNVTTYTSQKVILNDMSTHGSSSFLKSFWFPVTVGVTGFLFVVFIFVLAMTFFRRHKYVNEGEKLEDTSTDKSVKSSEKLQQCIKQSNTTPCRNSYVSSPKKSLFSYSPSKISTPIFSFTSPTKFKEKLVYPTSPIETAPPFPIQPSIDLLYPSSSNNAPSLRKPSLNNNNSSANSTDKSRTPSLLQSRRGSSASLIIDVSPTTPNREFSIPSHESPTEEILQRKSRCLKYGELRRAQENGKELEEEFWSIPPNTVARKDTAMKHSLKNRYPDILPNSRSIVRLTDDDRKDGNKYINANFIRGYDGFQEQFIATQGPLACTVIDLWHMVWQYKVSAIVMITKLKEKNKEKCVQYWPSPSSVTQNVYGDVTVTYDSEIQRDGYSIVTLYASSKGCGETRKITHYWFTAWPDHKVPKSSTQVISLTQDVMETHGLHRSPIIVHCSAGRGRTGCFIAIYNGISQINEDEKVDILKIVSQMRIQRGGMVDKDHQYKFIYNALYEYWSKKRASSPALSRLSIVEGVEEDEDSMDEGEHKLYNPVHPIPFTFSD